MCRAETVRWRRSMAGLAQRDTRLQEWVARDMLRGGIVALASPAAASHSAEMLSLLRDVLLQYLTTSPLPRQVCSLASGCMTMSADSARMRQVQCCLISSQAAKQILVR